MMRPIEEAPDCVRRSYNRGEDLRADIADRDLQQVQKRGDPYFLNLLIQKTRLLRDNAVAANRKFTIV